MHVRIRVRHVGSVAVSRRHPTQGVLVPQEFQGCRRVPHDDVAQVKLEVPVLCRGVEDDVEVFAGAAPLELSTVGFEYHR